MACSSYYNHYNRLYYSHYNRLECSLKLSNIHVDANTVTKHISALLTAKENDLRMKGTFRYKCIRLREVSIVYRYMLRSE